ncbi:hypothetical protein ACFLQW_01945 [Candidatus Zixiibacteriota bacterium]
MKPDAICEIRLKRKEVGQILDALDARLELWENTVRYARDEYVEDMIAEHSSLEEAEGIAQFYRTIINNINEQI